MQINRYGQILRTEEELIDLLYQNPDLDIGLINIESSSTDKFNQAAEQCNEKIRLHTQPIILESIEEFDKHNQEKWFMPEEYENFPMVEFLLDKTTNEEEYQRVVLELELYVKHDMMDLLSYLKYLVDTFREKNIVWGVGRGSSVASYCLFLIGLHKVDSLKYNLDIAEFLK